MISVVEARRIILEHTRPVGTEEVPLLDSLGRTLAQEVNANDNIPPFDNSAMDGYAVLSEDVAQASHQAPVVLEVVDDVPAGCVAQRELKKGETVRIMTGAPVPRGADCVVMVERTRRADTKVEIFENTQTGRNIRQAGEDIRRGERVLNKGRIIGPAEMGLLSSLGVDYVSVVKVPQIGILATGDDLVEIGEELTPGKIRNSNTYSLFGLVKDAGGAPCCLGVAKDNKDNLFTKIVKGLTNEILLISGGVSVGDYEFVKEVMADLGSGIKFWKVAMRPGKPLAFGVLNGTPVFGLPGNPVSSMISFEVFVRPALLKMLGRKEDDRKEVDVVLEEDIKKKNGLRYFLRAQTRWEDGEYHTRTTGPQGSGILKSMALANSLMILPEDEEFVEKGKRVKVIFID